ncbi:MAG: alpha/beta fold hydrolase [Chloroflexota bacterium]
MKPVLPVGFHQFSKNNFFNYQLNRWYALGYTRLADIQEAGRRIVTVQDYKREFIGLAQVATRENRLQNAAFYYRAAEFLTRPQDADKVPLYQKFQDTFYEGFREENIQRNSIQYSDGFLSAMRLSPAGGQPKKGTVVIHGGFDSFIEEFFCFWKYFSEIGYEVIAFDGPGQGATHRIHGLAHDHDWEKPVGAVLDHFGLDDVTLLGISFGGYWCVRAAAFEKRIKRLIVNPPLYDLLAEHPAIVKSMVWSMMRAERFMNWSIRFRMQRFPIIEHVVNQCLYINNKLDSEPIAAAHWLLAMNEAHLHSELVDQDVLLLAGEKDRFQSVKLYHKQKEALKNARSITGRVFTKAEHAENHCQMGNLGLALNVMGQWLDEKTRGVS